MTLSADLFKSIRRIQIKTEKYVQDILAGSYHSAFKGRGMEFEDVREYQPGDEIRGIDWNVTARMQYPYVKNFKEERELTVYLLVDISASNLFGSCGKIKKELIAELAALFTFSAIQNNDKVGLVLFSDQIEQYLAAQKGVRHALKIVRQLLAFNGKNKKTDVEKAITFLSKTQKRKCVVFLISDFLSPSFDEALTLLAKKHDVIGVHIQDPLEKNIPQNGLIEFRDLETSQQVIVDSSDKKVQKWLKEKKAAQLQNLHKLFYSQANGLMTIDLNKPYLDVVKEFFDLRRVR